MKNKEKTQNDFEVSIEITKKEPVKFSGTAEHIVHNADICTGCRNCMVICSLNHFGLVSPELAGIQVIWLPREGGLVEANVCLQCKSFECADVCPTDAIYVDEVTGARVIDQEKCTGCKVCIKACPNKPKSVHYYGIDLSPIRYNKEKNICFKCDLCGGDPLCLKFCPVRALSFSKKVE